MKHTVTQHLCMAHRYKSGFSEKQWMPELWPSKLFEDTEDRIYIGPQQVEIDVPDDFDPTAKQVAALEQQREAIRAKFTADIAAVNERLSKLQALTYEAAT